METNRIRGDTTESIKDLMNNPDLPDDNMEEGTDLGAIRIHHGVIGVISRIAALKVPGVSEMSGSFADGLASIIGKPAFDRGVRVEVDGQSVSVEVHVVIEFGVRIPQVSWRIQNEVRHAIEDMTGYKVRAVDVVIQSVAMPAAKKTEDA